MSDHEFLLRVSTDPVSGFGHLSRMLALRCSLKSPVIWFVDPKTSPDVRALIPTQDKIIEEQSITSAERLLFYHALNSNKLIICDSYQIECNKLASSCTAKILFFCDSNAESCAKNVTIVNCQPGVKPVRNNLCGPKFTPIDTRKKSQKEMDFNNIGEPINCLISFGGTDKNNLTALTLEALLSKKNLRKRIRPICLIGPYFQYQKIVENLLKSFPQSKVLVGYNSIIDIPLECPIAIGAPGLSHAERLFLGIATVLVAQNNQHKFLCERWQAEGCAISASAQKDSITAQLESLIGNNFKKAKSLSMRGQKLIDGKGAQRIVLSAEKEIQR